MPVLPVRRAARAAAVTALGLALAGGTAGLASAQTTAAPAPNSGQCTAAVSHTTVVLNDKKAVDVADATVRNDQAAFDKAVGVLNTDKATLVTLTSASQAVKPVSATDPTATDVLVTPVNGITSLAALKAAIAALTNTTVPADQAAVDAASATLTTDRGKLTVAQNDLRAAIADQTRLLCTGAPVVHGNPGGPVRSEASIIAEINGVACDANPASLKEIYRAIAARQAAGQPVVDAQAALDAKVNNLSCSTGAVSRAVVVRDETDCGVTAAPPVVTSTVETPAPGATSPTLVGTALPAVGSVVRYGALSAPATVTTQAVNPLASDGSVATTSGSEVATVPAGNASTGG